MNSHFRSAGPIKATHRPLAEIGARALGRPPRKGGRKDQGRAAGRGPGLVALLAVLSLLAAACTGGESDPPAAPQPEAAPGEQAAESVQDSGTGEQTAESVEDSGTGEQSAGAGDETASIRARESIEWEEFEDGVDFGAVFVPLDYADPDAGELGLGVLVHRATRPEDRVGYLLVNPGGPGGSGVEMAYGAAFGEGFSADVIERFDIVGFDPRGVGFSEPLFECGRPGDQLTLLSQIDPPYDSPEELAAGEAAAQLCVETMGPAAGLLHSEFAARDIDEIRKALGADQISYYGASYGSTLGVWYATLFPQQVRAMVVDGADNPVDDLSTQEARIASGIEEATQFEVLLGEALDACDGPDCPIYNDGEPRGYLAANAHRLAEVAEATNGNPLSGALGVITTLYAEETWPLLWQGLADLVERDDPALLAQFAMEQLGDSTGGTTFTEHINCLDSWVLYPWLDRETRLGDEVAQAAATEEHLPLLSLLDIQPPSTCPFYDGFAPPALDGPLDGSGVPILVIGNPSDPATPFTESQELVDETLSDGHLLEADHPAHVAYPANTCAVEAVHAVLIDLVPPSDWAGVCPTG